MVFCNYCGKGYKGGIHKLKAHLAGTGTVSVCTKVSPEKKDLMLKSIKSRKKQDSSRSNFILDNGFSSETPSDRDMLRGQEKQYDLSLLTDQEKENLKSRPVIDYLPLFTIIQPIIEDVREKGDVAVKEYTLKCDNVDLDQIVLAVKDLPVPELDEAARQTIDVAYENIREFHYAQRPIEKSVEINGLTLKRTPRAISSVGLYVPGGPLVQPSAILKLAIPAKIAGSLTIVVAIPPYDGTISKEVLYSIKKAGVTHILQAGGAQAIAAMAYGTASCPKVQKIFGAGNKYVAAAKMCIQSSNSNVAIDMLNGPSEAIVIADENANPSYVAADLLSQAEYGSDSQLLLVTAGKTVNVKAINDELKKQVKSLFLPAYAALYNRRTILANDMHEAIKFSSSYAPQRLLIHVQDDPKTYVDYIDNAGAVYLGPWSTPGLVDYAAGAIIPTNRWTRTCDMVSVEAFVKYVAVHKAEEEGLRTLAANVTALAALDGLHAHRNAVTMRLEDLNASEEDS